MRHTRFIGVTTAIVCSLAFSGIVHAEARKKKHNKDAVYKYQAEMEGHETRTFSLPDEGEKLLKALEEGEVEKAELVKSVNILEIVTDVGLWTIVVFLLLLFVLSRYAWKPMLEGLQRREQTILAAVEEAKIARKEQAEERAKFKAEMDEAYSKIPKMMEDARKDAENLKQEMRTQAQAEIQTERERLRREIETARDQALQEIWNQSVRLATMISAKAIRRSLSEEDHRRLLDESLAELQQADKSA